MRKLNLSLFLGILSFLLVPMLCVGMLIQGLAYADERSVTVKPKEKRDLSVEAKKGLDPVLLNTKYYALIIGNNNYKHIKKLNTAIADANAVDKILREKFGFKTKVLIDATRKEILDTINDFRKKLSRDDNLLIYYAGHGELDKTVDKSYWLPVDAQSDSPTEWIMADDLTSNIKRIISKHILIVSDSCYSGTLTRAVSGDLSKSGEERDEFIKKMMERPSRTLMASGGNEPVSDSGGGNNSVFAAAFLKALNEADKPLLTAEELFHDRVKAIVAGKSDQVPEYKEIRNSGHEGGDFIFQLKTASLGAVSTPHQIPSPHTLSEQTIKILKSLKKEVMALAFYRSEKMTFDAMLRQDAEDLLREYSYHTPKFTYKFIDPDKNTVLARQYGVSNRIIFLLSGKKYEKIGFESEEKITNAIIKVTRDEVKTIYFVKGHGENDVSSIQKLGYKAAKDAIEKENYLVKELLLMNEERVPADASVVIVSGPKRDFLQDELDKLKKYVENGGSLLAMVDPGHPLTIKNFLEGYEFKVGDDVIFDTQSRVYGANELTPVVYQYDKDHPLTSEFNLATYFYLVNTVDIEKDKKKGQYQLAMTGPNSWAEKDLKKWSESGEAAFDEGKEKRGPLSIAAVTTIPDKGASEAGIDKEGRFIFGKIIAFGDSDFANNTNINLAGNRELFLNTIGWLAEEADFISIRK